MYMTLYDVILDSEYMYDSIQYNNMVFFKWGRVKFHASIIHIDKRISYYTHYSYIYLYHCCVHHRQSRY